MTKPPAMFWSGETLSERLKPLIDLFAPERVDCAPIRSQGALPIDPNRLRAANRAVRRPNYEAARLERGAVAIAVRMIVSMRMIMI